MFGLHGKDLQVALQVATNRSTTLSQLAKEGYRPVRRVSWTSSRPGRVIGLERSMSNGGGGVCDVRLLPTQTRYYQMIGDSMQLTDVWTPGDDFF